MHYKGSCHCGNIAFEVRGELTGVMECNCSICSRKEALMWFVPFDHMQLTSSGTGVGTYTFNKHAIKHHFCQTCGIHPYAEGVEPKKGERTAAINVRCLEEVDLATLLVKQYDGRSK